MASPDPLTTEWVPIWNTAGAQHIIQDEGTALPQRNVLNFTGPGVIASDVGGKTTITITGTPQTPWLSAIDAAGFPLTGIPNIDFHYAGVKAGAISSFILGGNGALEFYTFDATDGYMVIHATTDGVGIRGAASTTYSLQVYGDCNVMGGVYRINGVPLALGQPQTPWAQNINGANFALSNVGNVVIGGTALSPGCIITAYAAVDRVLNLRGDPVSFGLPAGYLGPILQAVNSALNLHEPMTLYAATLALYGVNGVGVNKYNPAYAMDIAGDCNITGVYRVNGVPLSTGGSQTPWTQSIQGAGYALINASSVWIGTTNAARSGTALSVIAGSPVGAAAATQLIVGESSNNPAYQLQIGYAGINGIWAGAIQSVQASVGSFLYLNPLGGWVNVGGAGNPSCGLQLTGTGQATVSPTFPTGAQGCTLLLSDSLGPGASGGMLAFGGRGGDGSAFAAIKGYYSNGGGLTAGWLQFLTRRAVDATTFTPAMTIIENGYVGIDCLPACKLSTGSALATVKIASYDLSGTLFGIGVQSGVLTFGAGITEQGSAHMTLSGTGKLSIGTGNAASPACTLHVAAGGTYPGPSGVFIESGDMTSVVNGAPWYGVGRNSTTGGTQVAGYNYVHLVTSGLTVTQTGSRLGFGTTLADVKAAIYDDGTNLMGLGANASMLKYTTTANWSHRWYHGTTILMTLTYNGKCCIGPSGGATYDLQLNNDSAGKPTTTTWINLSDARLKRNIRDLEGGLDIITRLRPTVSEYNGLYGLPAGQRVVSFLAQEIREILPHTVGSNRGRLHPDDVDETDILDFNMHEVLFHLVLAVKQLSAQVTAMDNSG